MREELKVKRSYAIPENEMVIIKDTNTLLHNIVDSEIKEKDKEIERLTKQNKALNEMYELTKKEYIRLNNIINSFLAYLKGNEEHWKGTSYNWDSLIYGELAQRLEMKIEMSLEESDKE